MTTGNHEKMNALWAARKGSRPTWNTAEQTRKNWRRAKYKRAKNKTLRTHRGRKPKEVIGIEIQFEL